MALSYLIIRPYNQDQADIDMDFDEFVTDYSEDPHVDIDEERQLNWYLDQLTMPNNQLNWRDYV